MTQPASYPADLPIPFAVPTQPDSTPDTIGGIGHQLVIAYDEAKVGKGEFEAKRALFLDAYGDGKASYTVPTNDGDRVVSVKASTTYPAADTPKLKANLTKARQATGKASDALAKALIAGGALGIRKAAEQARSALSRIATLCEIPTKVSSRRASVEVK